MTRANRKQRCMTCGEPSENDLCGACERALGRQASVVLELSKGRSRRSRRTVERPPSHTTRRGVATSAARIKREPVEWLDPGRVPLGLVTVLAGVGGLGKSQWSCALAGRVSRGELGSAAATLLLTAEDSWATTVKPRLEAVGANLELVHRVSIATDEGEDGLTIPDDLPELERLVVAHRARLVVLDPLAAHLDGGIDSHKDQSVRRALAPLHRLAEAQGCAVVALIHLNKAQGLAPLMRLGGSVAFGNAARSVILLERDPDDPDGEEGSQRVLAHIKCNLGPLAPSQLYKVMPVVLPAIVDKPQVETSRLDLIGESAHNGRTLLAAVNEEERSAVDEAVEFLEAELGDGGRHLAAEILRDARKIGITEPTLRRARKRLEVRTEKAGFGRGWEWWLPKASSPETSTESDEGRRLRESPLPMRDCVPSERAENAEGVTHSRLTPSASPTSSKADPRTLDEALADPLFVQRLLDDEILVGIIDVGAA